jgi:peptidylglycine monooxygenase
MTRLIFGTGDYTYEVLQPFGQLPAGMEFGNTSHVAVDSKDRVYVYRRKDPPVLVFDGDGHLLTSWGDGLLVDAHGIYITPNDEIFLVDRDAHEVLKFDSEGRVLLRIGQRARASWQAPFNHPADVAVSSTGDIYVADGYGNSIVHRFSSEGRLLLSWGMPGDSHGEFSTPHGIWVDNQDRVYVVDRENNRVQIFDSEGGFIAEWRNFYHPMDLFMDASGVAYVTDQTPRFAVLNAEGVILARGRTPDNGHGVWGDSRGNLYFAGNERGVVKLVKQ